MARGQDDHRGALEQRGRRRWPGPVAARPCTGMHMSSTARSYGWPRPSAWPAMRARAVRHCPRASGRSGSTSAAGRPGPVGSWRCRRRPERAGRSAAPRPAAGDEPFRTLRNASGSSNQNALPAPSSLSRPIRPPMASTSRRQMARPKPGAADSGASLRRRLGRTTRTAGPGSQPAMPIPVSVTSKRVHHRPSASGDGTTLIATSPGRGELDGVGGQVQQDLADPAGIPVQRWRVRRARSRRPARALCRRPPAPADAPTSATSRRGSKSVSSRSTLPASSLEKSRMSLMTVSSASPAVCTPSAYCRWTSSSVGFQQQTRSVR